MIRLNCVVEGQTELGFCDAVLKPHLEPRQVFAVARCVETSRKRGRIDRGGIVKYERSKRDLTRWMREDQNRDARFTTMIDLYGLPSDFPGYEEAARQSDPYNRVTVLEARLAEDLGDRRLIPYVQLHEFEALLFCDPSGLADLFIGNAEAVRRLADVASAVASPELMNDGDRTAPSKRIIEEIPQYAAQKAFAGSIVAERIGIGLMRQKCSHFDAWVGRLELLSQ